MRDCFLHFYSAIGLFLGATLGSGASGTDGGAAPGFTPNAADMYLTFL